MPDQAPTTQLHEPADGPVAGATLVIEAPTAEAALTQLHEQLGADARVVEVRRIARGGIAGFFARELVELHAASSGPATSAAPAPAAVPPAAPEGSPIDRLLRAEAESGQDEVDFATYLRTQLHQQPAPAAIPAEPTTHAALLERATAVARLAVRSATGDLEPGGGIVDPATDRLIGAPQPPADPTPAAALTTADPEAATPTADVTSEALGPDLAEPTAAVEPGPAWSVAALVKLGLPAGLVRGLEVAPPADDVAWTAALAGALRPVCRPLPAGKSLLIGPRARSIANGLGAPTATVGQPIRSRAATVAAAVGKGAASRSWLVRARGNRWLHLVVGGSGWRELLHLDPLAVSWAATEDVPEAIRLATELGLVLGAGPLGPRVQRARPLDVALAVRELLPATDVVPRGARGGDQ